MAKHVGNRLEKALPWISGAILLLIAVLLPVIVDRPRFWLPNIGVRTMWLGIIAMSMVFLNRYAGLLSLAQVAIAGGSAYGLGYMVVNQGASFWVGATVGLIVGDLEAFLTAVFAVSTVSIILLLIIQVDATVLHNWAGSCHGLTCSLWYLCS